MNSVFASLLQVTYSQLDLGENYHSYNHNQSNPNIRRDIEEANLRFNQGYDSAFESRRSYAKSAPGSRATTPTRLRQRDRLPQPAYLPNLPRSRTAASQYSQNEPLTVLDFDNLSFESRSLAGYSNFSGRDSAMDGSSTYRGDNNGFR